MGFIPCEIGLRGGGGAYSVPHALEGYRKMRYGPAHVRMPEHSIISFKKHLLLHHGGDRNAGGAGGGAGLPGGNMAGWALHRRGASPELRLQLVRTRVHYPEGSAPRGGGTGT